MIRQILPLVTGMVTLVGAGTEHMGYPVTDEIMPATPPHTRRYIPGDEI